MIFTMRTKKVKYNRLYALSMRNHKDIDMIVDIHDYDYSKEIPW